MTALKPLFSPEAHLDYILFYIFLFSEQGGGHASLIVLSVSHFKTKVLALTAVNRFSLAGRGGKLSENPCPGTKNPLFFFAKRGTVFYKPRNDCKEFYLKMRISQGNEWCVGGKPIQERN